MVARTRTPRGLMLTLEREGLEPIRRGAIHEERRHV
jgi:hypothetical protein